MKTLSSLVPTVLCTISIATGLMSPSLALMNGITGSGKTDMDKLKDKGYDCERVATNFIECTKPGEPTHWCTNNGECEEAPQRRRRNSQVPPVYYPGAVHNVR